MSDTTALNVKIAKMRVLIIDDNTVDRAILKSQLESMGFDKIHECRNGNEGIFKVQNSFKILTPYHLIITDWRMPEKDGLSFLKFIKSEEAFANIPIMMLTGIADKENVKHALSSGVDAFLLKPINGDILIKKINELIGTMNIL